MSDEESEPVVEEALVELLDPSAPTDASALKMAPMRPPPGGGPGGALDWDELARLDELVLLWLWPANIADNADSGMESPELLSELTLMKMTPDLKTDFERCDPWIHIVRCSSKFSASHRSHGARFG
jgi:hypothetical protein